MNSITILLKNIIKWYTWDLKLSNNKRDVYKNKL
jgi:hypothetical protein